ncbi:alpha/beta fold hydrolase [Thalassococcus sp. S3]|uniref:alpha/beta fold hydrolase n=1 Tax=Thalassococcus sp. S3 TaxID=2017482 RepID=UPI001024422F|nr:alpha/beta hydrolase [Thalassococcus sp. S3]QBF30719.1 alpha/beta hydrolase [Thalassococcus sp. S3]
MPYFSAPDGLSLHYTDEGTGLPLICLSGLTRDGRDFNYLAPHLTGCRIIRLDYRGRGASEWADWQTYTIPVEAADVVALMDHLDVARAAILGTSRGGLIAMTLAAIAPDRVIGAALNDVGPVIERDAVDQIIAYIGRRPSWRSHEEAADGLAAALPTFENVPHTRWLNEARLHFVETEDGLDLTYDPRLRDAILAADTDEVPDLWPFMDALAQRPLCVLRGANSQLLSAATFGAMQVRYDKMIAAEIPGRGHVPFLDESQSLRALHTWLDRLQ